MKIDFNTVTIMHRDKEIEAIKISDIYLFINAENIEDSDQTILTDEMGFRYKRIINPDLKNYFIFQKL